MPLNLGEIDLGKVNQFIGTVGAVAGTVGQIGGAINSFRKPAMPTAIPELPSSYGFGGGGRIPLRGDVLFTPPRARVSVGESSWPKYAAIAAAGVAVLYLLLRKK